VLFVICRWWTALAVYWYTCVVCYLSVMNCFNCLLVHMCCSFTDTHDCVVCYLSVMICLFYIFQIRVPTDSTGLKLTLYQFQTCPFCCKLRSVLDYYGFSYDVIEVNSVTKKQIKWSDYKKVPILVCEGIGQDGYLVSLCKLFLFMPRYGWNTTKVGIKHKSIN
jgi:glutaredoxin